jgi:isopenicillin N synthase-like dioxygenase
MQITETTDNNAIVDLKHPDHAQHLFESLLNNRYAIIRNHSIVLEGLNHIYQQWEHFFAQSESEKEKYLYSLETDDGYVPVNIEHAKDAIKPDLKEFYQLHLDGMLHHKNACSEESKKLFLELADLGEYITKAIDDMLPTEIKANMTTSLCSAVKNSKRHCMRFIHYPPCGDSNELYRSAPHDDICLITIILPTRGEGLMMRKNDGWTQEDSVDTSLVVFNSEMLEICTHGYMKSMTHQVTTDLTENARYISRYSMPFFVHPHSATLLKSNLTSYAAVH